MSVACENSRISSGAAPAVVEGNEEDGAGAPLSARDRALCHAVRAALRNTGYPAVAELQCEAIDGLILLVGELPSFYLKQIAQEAVLRIETAKGVRNLAMVNYSEDEYLIER